MKFIENLKKNGYSILFTAVFLAALILLNIFVGMLTDRFFLKVDLTDTGLYTLSDEAAEFLSGVNETVDIIVLSEESTWRTGGLFEMFSNILRNYSAGSGGNIRIQYVNPDLNTFNGPNYNNSLAVLKAAHTELEDMTRNDIIFLSSRRAVKVSAFDLIIQSRDALGNASLTGVRVDQEFISALITVLNENIPRIVFLNNHQETPKEFIKHIFERSGYTGSTLNLALSDIPEDTIVLVSADPKSDFLDEEIVKIEQFLNTGGNVIILHGTQSSGLTRLNNFLAEWGVAIEDKLIFDEEFTFIPQLGVIGAYVVAGELPSTEKAEWLTTETIPMGIFMPRPLSAVDARGEFNRIPLVRTFSSSSYAKDISEGGITSPEREAGDESGPFTLAYNVRRLGRDANNNTMIANLIVAGATMFDDDFLRSYGNSFYNDVLIMDIAQDLNPFGGYVFIPPKELTDSHMLVSTSGAMTVLVVMVIALPLVIISSGFVVWYRRRHK